MKYQIIGKNIKVTEGIKEKVERKLDLLEKYLIIKGDTDCRVVVSVETLVHKIEVTIPTKYAILRAEVVDQDLYNAIDLVVDKLEDQLRRAKTKMDRRHRESLGRSFDIDAIEDIEVEEIPVKTKTISVDTMDLDTAIANLELLGHSFYIYRDDEEEKVAVVYKRRNGGYGLIEIEN